MIEGIARLRETDPRQLGPFRLFGVLGRGDAGSVHLGKGAPGRGGRKRAAAVRTVRPELLRDRQLRARLRRQTARIAEAVDSPFVADAFGCELDSERPWIAEAFVPGVPLSALVAAYGPLPERSVRALGGGLARALAALNAAGTAHGHLRGSDVLLTAAGPRLVGHGLALDSSGSGASAGSAEDVFALGAVLGLAASARHPFAGTPLPTAREDPDLSGVPDALCVPLLACLHKSPESRPHPESLARTLDLSGSATRPAREWLPDPYLHEIGRLSETARALIGRRGWSR
ncbi:hypothetical protein [Streptomyces sp. NPDC007083]|uniref:hypothetical protein n=1 Tax=Streptomyces sp. NPDC007083 TaxID=3156913 RepID=UPI0033C1F4DC